MKKICIIITLLFMCFLLTGCGIKTTNCSLNNKQSNYEINTNYSINSKEGIVKNIKINQTIKSNDKKILKDFEKQINNQYEYNNRLYGGYKYSIKISEKELNSNVSINYSEIDMEKFVKDNAAMKEYVNNKNQLTLEGIKKLYRSTGAKCE